MHRCMDVVVYTSGLCIGVLVHFCMYVRMHACMHGWMDGWMNAWMDGWMGWNGMEWNGMSVILQSHTYACTDALST